MPPWINRIACLSTSRADAGIYRPLLKALAANDAWRVSCLAGGTHLADGFGHTVSAFDGLERVGVIPVEHWSAGDDPASVAAAAGRATGGFADALARENPDLVFVLGDRPEMLAATLAATILRLPIAHLHGGDVTAGAYDDACRNAITKLAHLHFPALPEHGRRIAAMGEDPARIHVVGALALDALREFQPMPVAQLSQAISLDFSRPVIVFAFHPETLSDLPAGHQIEIALQGVCDAAGDAGLLLIGPNCDVGHAAIVAALEKLASTRPNTRLVNSLDQHVFWSCLSHVRALVGNSSAGLLEAPSLRLPVVNIGHRQSGRLRAANVLNAPFDAWIIAETLRRALSPAFSDSLSGVANPYGDGHAAARIVRSLLEIPAPPVLLRKRPPVSPPCG